MESNYGEQQVIPTMKYSNASNRKQFSSDFFAFISHSFTSSFTAF